MSPRLRHLLLGFLVPVTLGIPAGCQIADPGSGDAIRPDSSGSAVLSGDDAFVILTPEEGDLGFVGAPIHISWTFSFDWDYFDIYVRRSPADPWESIATLDGDAHEFSWIATGPPTSTAQIRMRALKAVGGGAYVNFRESAFFTIAEAQGSFEFSADPGAGGTIRFEAPPWVSPPYDDYRGSTSHRWGRAVDGPTGDWSERAYLWFDTDFALPPGVVVSKVEFVYSHELAAQSGGSVDWAVQVYEFPGLVTPAVCPYVNPDPCNPTNLALWNPTGAVLTATHAWSGPPANAVIDLGASGVNALNLDPAGTGIMLVDQSGALAGTEWWAVVRTGTCKLRITLE